MAKILARRDVTAAKLIEAIGGDEVGEAIDGENRGDSGTVIDEADEGAGEEHAALHADEDSGVGAGKFAGGNDFLHEGIDRGPIHRGTGAGDEGHQVEVPDLNVAAPGDVCGGKDGDAAGEIKGDAEIAAIQAVNEHAAEKGHEKAGQSDDDDLQADLEGRMGGGEDEPTDATKFMPLPKSDTNMATKN